MVSLFRDGCIGLVAILSGSIYEMLRISKMIRGLGFSFQQYFLPLAHLHEFHYMIDYMFIYAHDYYVLHLYLLYYMINHRGIYLDEMMNTWLH
jgi:hypothetical protein